MQKSFDLLVRQHAERQHQLLRRMGYSQAVRELEQVRAALSRESEQDRPDDGCCEGCAEAAS